MRASFPVELDHTIRADFYSQHPGEHGALLPYFTKGWAEGQPYPLPRSLARSGSNKTDVPVLVFNRNKFFFGAGIFEWAKRQMSKWVNGQLGKWATWFVPYLYCSTFVLLPSRVFWGNWGIGGLASR